MSSNQSKIKEATKLMKASDFSGDLNTFLAFYNFQPELTKRLDNIENTSLDQSLINEIVLGKVNRYVRLGDDNIELIKKLKVLQAGEHNKGNEVLKALLGVNGVDLPMASTILRFINPKVFQIIDRHAYRAVYGKKYPLYQATSAERKISLYFDYIDDLIKLCKLKGLTFTTIDRLLYIFDKKNNGKLNSKGQRLNQGDGE
jgi:thermostable 8-oxoguanine DNA glycosylase